jgi:outer membrane protein assembly factor BamB
VRVAREGDAFTTRAVYESNELCCHFASPVRRGNYIYGLDEQRDLTCLDLRKGKAVWRQRGFLKGSVILVDDTLLLLGENGNLALAEASPEGYMALAMARPLRDRCWAMPALAGGLLLIRDRKSVIVLEVGK